MLSISDSLMNNKDQWQYCYNREYRTLTQMDSSGKIRQTMQMPPEDLEKLQMVCFCETLESVFEKDFID